jgi:hypothetical protein
MNQIKTRYLSVIFFILAVANPIHGRSESRGAYQDYIQYGVRQQSKLSRLAEYVTERGDDEQLEFAMITLGAMVDAYAQVLQQSSHSKPRTVSGRKKQITWGWATSRMIASLNHQLKRLEGGALFMIRVDHLHRILLVIDGQVVEVTGPRFRSQSRIEQQIVEFFCLTRDCSWLEPEEPEKSETEIAVQRSLSKGAWLFQQNGRPTYVIGGLIHFEFPNFTDRKGKAELSRRITDEIEQLILETKKISGNDQSIYWPALRRSLPAKDNPVIKLIEGDTATGVNVAMLSQLHQADWERLINWIHDDGIETGDKLTLKHLDSL